MACQINSVKKVTKSSNKCNGGIAGGGNNGSPTLTRVNKNHHQNCYSSTLANFSTPGSAVKQNSVQITAVKTTSIQQPAQISQTEEMAGDIRIMETKKPRKHWSLRDRTATNVHILRANLAEEGCDQAQLGVARQLLQDSNDPELRENSQRENSRLAIYWLVKSSEQGNEEATKLLKECISSGKGVTAQNFLDANFCISTPTNEKLTYKAAKLLYLKLSNGEKFITTMQIASRINSLNKKSVHFSDEASDEESKENSFNSAATIEDQEVEDMSDIPLNETFTFENGISSVNNKANEFSSFNSHSNGKGEKLTLEEMLKAAGRFNEGENPVPAINSNNQQMRRHQWNFGSQFNLFLFQLLILCVLTEAISWNNCAMFAASFLSFWASFNILGWRRCQDNFNDWSKAFGSIQHENQLWTDKDAQRRLVLNTLTPYISTISLAFIVMFWMDGLNIIKLVTGLVVVDSLIRGLIKGKFITFRIALLGIVINAPEILTITTNVVEICLPTELQVYISEDILTIFKEFTEATFTSNGEKFNFLCAYGVSVCQTVIVGYLMYGGLKDFVEKRLPELIIALWLTELVKIFGGLLEADILDWSIGGIGLLIHLVIIVGFRIIQSKIDLWKVILSLSLLLVMCGTFITVISESLEENPIKIAVSTLRLSKDPVNIQIDINQLPHLDFNEYDKNCHREAWKTSNPAATQLKCFAKYGKSLTAVRWQGRVTVVKIKEFKKRPSAIYSNNDIIFDITVNLLSSEAINDDSSWNFLPGSDKNGHPSPAIVLVSTAQKESVKEKLTEFMLGLKSGDIIEFHGVLDPYTVGGLRPIIEHVQSIMCIKCPELAQNPDLIVVNPEKKHQTLSMKSAATTNDNFYTNAKTFLSQLINHYTKVFNLLLN